MKDLEQLAKVVSLATAENVDQNNPNIMDKVGKYFSDNKFVSSSLRNGRIILKDDLYDNVMEMIIKGTQGGLLKPTPDTKKPADGHKQSCEKYAQTIH